MLTRWFLSCEQTAISWHHFALPHLKSMQPPAVFVSARSRQTMITILQGVFQILQVSKPCQVAIGTKRRLMWIGTVSRGTFMVSMMSSVGEIWQQWRWQAWAELGETWSYLAFNRNLKQAALCTLHGEAFQDHMDFATSIL
jgi:hypothetical protein